MIRYFYNDPLEASWMWDKFGMKFIGQDGSGEIGDPYSEGYSIAYLHEEFDVNPPYYIHPKSLHLLEPQVGDLCELDIVDNIREPKGWSIYKKPFPDYVKRAIPIQRNGVAFMWPESESE